MDEIIHRPGNKTLTTEQRLLIRREFLRMEAKLALKKVKKANILYQKTLVAGTQGVLVSSLLPPVFAYVPCPKTGKMDYVPVVPLSKASHKTTRGALGAGLTSLAEAHPSNVSKRIEITARGSCEYLIGLARREKGSPSWKGTTEDLCKVLGHNSGAKGESILSEDQRSVVFNKNHGDLSRIMLENPELVKTHCARYGLRISIKDNRPKGKASVLSIRFSTMKVNKLKFKGIIRPLEA